jgi:DNA-binding NarL/FixJ family response regulator
VSKKPNRLRILLADDHELVRHGIRGILKARPHWRVVGEAANGRFAVEKAKKLKPSIVIVDLEMPEMDGLEATRQIRKAVPNTRVLVLTMHQSDQMVRHVLEAGAQGYVLKSDVARQLVKAVESISRGKVFLTPKVSQIVLNGFLKANKDSKRDQNSQTKPTPREVQIIRLLADGKANKEIADALGITIRTVQTHRAKIMTKLGLHSITELVRYAFRNQIASP